MQRAKETTTLVGALRGCFVFLTWTLTSFACHFAAKQFLNFSHDIWGDGASYVDVTVLTFAQISTCFALLYIPFLSGLDKLLPDTLFVVLVSHTLATMATNFSMTLVQADSTFAIKLMEPITSAVISMVVMGTTLTGTAYCSLPLIVVGAVGFIGNPFANRMLGLGAWYAFVSNVILAVRNLGIKLMNKEKQFVFRSYKMIVAYYAIIIAIGLWGYLYLSNGKAVINAYTCLVISATFHVIYSYVSTGIVLQYLSVVSHSVANIWKRILVVLLLYSVGQRSASATNVLFLLLCIAGLFLYVYGQSAVKIVGDTDVPTNYRKRLTIVLAIVVCVVMVTSWAPLKQNGWRKVDMIQQSRDLLAYDSQEIATTASGTSSKILRDPKIQQFLSWRLIDHSNETDILAPKLTSTMEVLLEAKRITLSMSSDIFGTYKYAFLLDMANFENKGDPAINMGELFILRELNIEVLFHCHIGNCTAKALAQAKNLTTKYRTEDLVILCSGGGNMGGYPNNDYLRFKIFQSFADHKVVVFPQSTWFHNAKHLNASKRMYSSHKDLNIMLRDKVSLEFVRTHFPKAKSYLVPDAALSIGPVRRFMPPIYDIIWLRRSDGESTKYKVPVLPANLTVMVSDWWTFKTPIGKNVMENTFLFTTTGFMFIQRGRVLITDRLHGHIFAVILNIPHVIIDNKIKKITNFRRSWTAGLENVRVAKDAQDAVVKAVELLHKYHNALPHQVAFMKSKP